MPIGILASLAVCAVLYVAVSLVLTGLVSYKKLDVEAPKTREEWAQLRADTERYLPTYPALCRRITENFVLTCGLLPTD